MKERILVIEDEDDIRELLRYNLERAGYSVDAASDGEQGLLLARAKPPALILLDLMLPGISGFEVCRVVRTDLSLRSIPIIIVSARGEEGDVVAGLELGADDYLPKPFSPRVLLARVKSVLRRSTGVPRNAQAIVHAEPLVVDPLRREVLVEGALVELSNTEFKILHFLVRHPGIVFTRDQIVDGVHGDDYPATDRSIDVQVVGLRKKLGVCGALIETVRGVGYRFKG
jgi:two-component system alkaline phosphatase synthesis response regulator PhoP